MIGVYVKTKYSLFLSLIKLNHRKEELIYFLEEETVNNLNLNKLNVVVLKNFKRGNYLINKYKKWNFNNKLLKKLNKVEKVYLQDHIPYSQFFLNNFKKEIFLLEDGIMNYNYKILEEEYKRKIKKLRINNFIKKFIIEKRTKDYKRFGLSDKIKKIYLTGILPIPNLIKDKVEIININEIWSNLSQEAKKEILEVFYVDIEKFQIFDEEDEKILLLTQPLSEDEIITEEEKIKIYREIIEKQNGRKIYIKAHPREKTNYGDIFKELNIKIIENGFPIELLLLLNINFSKVITLFSTGALNFKGKSEVEFIGTEKYPKLYERFGEINI